MPVSVQYHFFSPGQASQTLIAISVVRARVCLCSNRVRGPVYVVQQLNSSPGCIIIEVSRSHTIIHVGRDGSVGIATCYELDSPGIKSLW